MKKLFLITVICIAILNCNAQIKHPVQSTRQMSDVLLRINGQQELSSLKKQSSFIIPDKKNITELKTKSLIALYDSIYYWHWDTLTNGWAINPLVKTINIVYDANNNMTSKLCQQWNGSAWVNTMQYTYTYDANNNMTSYQYDTYKYTYTYDANNNRTSKLKQHWNGTAWVNNEQYTYTYDVNNNRTSELYQNWNGSAWVNSWQYTYTYDANNNMTSELYQDWTGTYSYVTYQYTYTYDANNNNISELEQGWDGTVWVNTSLCTYTYDANNNKTSYLVQGWNGTAWVNALLYTYTYDVNNNMTGGLSQEWNGSAWENSYQWTSTYDANNFMQSVSNKYWDNTGTAITQGDSTYYYFHTVAGVYDLLAKDESIAVYPNPANSKLFVESKNDLKDAVITVYNINSQILLQMPLQKKITVLDISDFNSGFYFVKVASDKGIAVKKFIKE